MPKEKTDKAAKAPKGSKKKDPNAPKRNASAYMIFCSENRPIVKEENPEAKFGEMGKLLGAKWKELNEEGKAIYEQKAAEEKKKYEAEKAKYEAKGGASKDDDDE